MRIQSRLPVALVALLLPAILNAQDDVLRPGTARAAGMSDQALRAAVSLYADAVTKGKIVGGVLLIARRGQVVVHEAFGLRDWNAKLPMERTTMFRMSSNTKPLIATAVAILAERDRLRFSDSVKHHLPSWNNRKARGITIHQLLSHTSGIRIDAMFAPAPLFRWPWSRPPTLRSETDRIGRVGAKVTPGTSYFYTNAGYNALAGLIETVSDQPLGLFLRDEIYRKLGMRDSYNLEVGESLDGKLGRMGPTYVLGDHGGWTPLWKPGDPPEVPFARGSGGLITTAWDYAVFMQMLLNGGIYGGVRLLRAETVRTILTAHTPPGARPYGYGWGINEGGIFTHSGSTGTYAWGDPTRGIIVVALANTPDATELRSAMMEIVSRAADSFSVRPRLPGWNR
jgi:CubicO group peptidase (beta-lactamase class C family)